MSPCRNVGLVCHHGPMAKTITRDLDRRSREQSAQVVLRMSPEQRAAMTRLARRRGTSLTALVLAYLTPDLDDERETA